MANKTLYLDDGKVSKKASQQIFRGEITEHAIESIDEYARIIAALKPNQAIVPGITNLGGTQKLVKIKHLPDNPGAVARSKDFLSLPADGGIFVHDIDVVGEEVTPKTYWDSFLELFPEFQGVACCVSVSSSSYIQNSEGDDLVGLRGFHIAVPFTGNLERFSEIYILRAWAADLGRYNFGTPNKKTGVPMLLERFPADLAVWKGHERLIFEAAPTCEDGLVSKRPSPKVRSGKTINLDSIEYPDEETVALANANKAAAKAVARQLQKKQTVKTIRAANPELTPAAAAKEADRRINDCERGILQPDHPLYKEDGSVILAGDLTNEHLNLQLRDPQEPDYHDGALKAIVKVGQDGKLYITSRAHGGKLYTIAGAVEPLDLNFETVAAAFAVFAEELEINRDSEIVKSLADRFGVNNYKLFRAYQRYTDGFDIDWLIEHLPLDSKDHKKAEKLYKREHGLNGEGGKEATVADQLVEIGRSTAVDYFQTIDRTVYADVRINGILKTWPIEGKNFKNWLRREYFDLHGVSVASDALKQAIATLDAINDTQCIEREINVRAAKCDGVVYIDMCDRDSRVIKISPDGWEIAQDYPVRFKAGSGVALPEPVRGGDLDLLRDLCNFDFDNWVKILMFLIQWVYPTKGYPIMFLVAPPQSGKTTIAETLKKLVDPSTINVRGTISDPRDFGIQASQRRVILIDNLSHITEDQSNMLCGVATGSGFSTRTLHSNDEETIFRLNNPLIFTGIAAMASKGDLLSRGVTVALSEPEELITPEDFEARFEELQPRIAGALYDLLSKVLAILPSVQGTYKGRERFGKFIELGLAIEQAIGWPEGTVLRVISEGRETAHETAIEASPVGEVLSEFMLARECWTGTMTELYQTLSAMAPEKLIRGKYWPIDATRLSKKINELKPDFRALGIEITPDKRNGVRTVTIERVVTVTESKQAEQPSVKTGDSVVLQDSTIYDGLSNGQKLVVNGITKSDSPPSGFSGWWCSCLDSSNQAHPVWIEHLNKKVG